MIDIVVNKKGGMTLVHDERHFNTSFVRCNQDGTFTSDRKLPSLKGNVIDFIKTALIDDPDLFKSVKVVYMDGWKIASVTSVPLELNI